VDCALVAVAGLEASKSTEAPANWWAFCFGTYQDRFAILFASDLPPKADVKGVTQSSQNSSCSTRNNSILPEIWKKK
jgi:hypothetical protein